LALDWFAEQVIGPRTAEFVMKAAQGGMMEVEVGKLGAATVSPQEVLDAFDAAAAEAIDAGAR